MVILSASNDVFTNPNNPWYYVVGAAFLVLILAMLTVYIVLSGKKNKKAKEAEELKAKEAENADADSATVGDGEREEDQNAIDGAVTEENSVQGDTFENNDSAESEIAEVGEENAETVDAADEEDKKEITEESAETVDVADEIEAKSVNAETTTVADVEETEAEQAKSNEPVDEEKTMGDEAAPQTVKKTAKKPAAKTVAESEKSGSTKSAPAKQPAKKTSKTTAKANKPFVDRLIETKAVHGIYNEIKNTVLSYPGVKAKLGKEGEVFSYGADKKAALSIDGDNINLYLALDDGAAPAQLGLKKSDDAELPVTMIVTSSNIDTAQKAIVFAMNVSMLTRNGSHRRVDYVKRAMDAKARAKSKK